ncbi:MAG TPA: uroporphyrinogen-III C-methyltransferase [Polyangia bacterium]|nr:uroporphyrinogen-III C-methyltransferase [Polyangia bacterium]
MNQSGTVFLVGAGPGDPKLLTVRAAELLRDAEVVAYDALISDAVLAEIGPRAERISVGHRGKGASSAEYKIHPDVIARAREGKNVVRLKQGDPLVFGRGGEEAEELHAAGIAFEIVPGVSAALGAAAYAGIPLTHRRVSSDVTFATGHDLLAGTPASTDWAALARARGTVVLFMAAKKLGENLARLVENGRAPSTPAAWIARATTARQRVIVGTLGDLVAKTADVDRDDPALIVVGEVVSLRETLGWIEKRPLHGRRILVARARPGESQLAAGLRALGAEVIEAPSVSAAAVDPAALREQLARAGAWDWVMLPSAEAVDAARAELAHRAIITVGERARARLREAGLEPALHVAGSCRDELSARAELVRGRTILIVTDESRRPNLVAELKELGALAATAVGYATRAQFPPPPREPFDAVVLPSSSAAELLYGSDYGRALAPAPAIAIGPLTEAAARPHAARVIVAGADRVDAVIAKVREVLA